MTDPYPTLLACLTTATAELGALHGLVVAPTGSHTFPPQGRQILGTIGFGGPHMKGALVVVADEQLWKAVAPAGHGNDEALLTDLVAEFANMLLGRVRNAVLSLGADLAVAIPSAVSGSNLAPHRCRGERPDWHVFHSERGSLFVRLQVAFRRGFCFVEESPWSPRPNEADLVLF